MPINIRLRINWKGKYVYVYAFVVQALPLYFPLLTVDTSWPGDIGESVIREAGQSEAPEVVVVLKSVVGGTSITYVDDSFIVSGGI